MPIFARYPYNAHGRDFVVGDVHGCFDALHVKLREVAFDAARDLY